MKQETIQYLKAEKKSLAQDLNDRKKWIKADEKKMDLSEEDFHILEVERDMFEAQLETINEIMRLEGLK